MDELRLDGTTIRGVVQGRLVNCVVRSVPDGLMLPPGRYLLRPGEPNPVYGPFLSVEAASGPGGVGAAADVFKMPPGAPSSVEFKMPPGAPSAVEFKMPPAALKDSPAAIATLVPADPAPGAIKFGPGAIKFTPGANPATRQSAPGKVADAPAMKFFDPPAMKFDTPSMKFDGTPAIKFFFVAGQGLTARVIIAIRPIGQNSLVAQAGFSDLADAVQRAGGVVLIVS